MGYWKLGISDDVDVIVSSCLIFDFGVKFFNGDGVVVFFEDLFDEISCCLGFILFVECIDC